jgi:hypothetical protein
MATPASGKSGSTLPDWLPLLAAAIVQQAMADALDPALPASVRREARRFLAGSAEFRFWGQMAEWRLFN